VHEYRQNSLTGNWVIISPGRAARPQQFTGHDKQSLPQRDDDCDFCPGNEHKTTPEVYAVRDDYSAVDREGWHVRVVANKYPAVTIDAAGVPTPASAAPDRVPAPEVSSTQSKLRPSRPGVGMHEVVIESPAHDRHLALQDTVQATRIVETLRHRYRMIMQARDVRYISVIKNHGRRSGSSLHHPHLQIIATAVVPPSAGFMVDRQEAFAKEAGRSYFEAVLEEELSSGKRIVGMNEEFVTLSPWASQVPYEMWIVPRRQMSAFGDLPDEQMERFAIVLRDALYRLHQGAGDPDYSFAIHSAPKGQRAQQHHRWFVQIAPRLTTPAGFEFGTGMYINTVAPEDAAATMRNVAPQTIA
jgi:UDPglucose--hexose-1-phosphate uridylyltransferase